MVKKIPKKIISDIGTLLPMIEKAAVKAVRLGYSMSARKLSEENLYVELDTVQIDYSNCCSEDDDPTITLKIAFGKVGDENYQGGTRNYLSVDIWHDIEINEDILFGIIYSRLMEEDF